MIMLEIKINKGWITKLMIIISKNKEITTLKTKMNIKILRNENSTVFL